MYIYVVSVEINISMNEYYINIPNENHIHRISQSIHPLFYPSNLSIQSNRSNHLEQTSENAQAPPHLPASRNCHCGPVYRYVVLDRQLQIRGVFKSMISDISIGHSFNSSTLGEIRMFGFSSGRTLSGWLVVKANLCLYPKMILSLL